MKYVKSERAISNFCSVEFYFLIVLLAISEEYRQQNFVSESADFSEKNCQLWWAQQIFVFESKVLSLLLILETDQIISWILRCYSPVTTSRQLTKASHRGSCIGRMYIRRVSDFTCCFSRSDGQTRPIQTTECVVLLCKKGLTNEHHSDSLPNDVPKKARVLNNARSIRMPLWCSGSLTSLQQNQTKSFSWKEIDCFQVFSFKN